MRKVSIHRGLLAGLLLAAGMPAAGQNAFVRDSLPAYVAREMQRWDIPGAAVCVVHAGRVVFSGGFGVRDLERREPVDENTLFQIASCTKAFTGTAMALLHASGRLSLDDKVTRHLPGFRLYDTLATREATLRDMLTHRIGFRTFQGDFLHWDGNLSRGELVQNLRNIEPVYGFRARYGYCNAGFVVAGQALAAVTDTSWDDFLRARFFGPLGMRRTDTDPKAIAGDKNAARPYTLVDGRLTALAYADIEALAPAASISSCVGDLAHWLAMLLDSGRFEGRTVVPPEALRMTWSSQTVVREPAEPGRHFHTYGLGWFLEDYAGRKVISHDGGANGFLSNATILPEEGFGFAILTNTDANGFYEALQKQLVDAALGLPYRNHSLESHERFALWLAGQDSIRRDLLGQSAGQTAALPLADYAGRYTNKVYGAMEIKLTSDGLVAFFSHHPRLQGALRPAGGHRFVCVYSDPTYGVKEVPFEVNGGRVQGATFRVNDFVDYLPYYFAKTP
jgi:CubicO group peptidase (beta-lactamase class C family)